MRTDRCCLMALAVMALAAAPPARAQADAAIDRARAMTGCWVGMGVLGRSIVEERWMPPRGGTMLGVSRTVRGDSTVSVEMMILRVRGDTLVYEAHPVSQATADFTFVMPSGSDPIRTFEFANPAHDFPQKIIYRAIGADSLVARVEGPRRGGWGGTDFPMRRVRCDEGDASR